MKKAQKYNHMVKATKMLKYISDFVIQQFEEHLMIYNYFFTSHFSNAVNMHNLKEPSSKFTF